MKKTAIALWLAGVAGLALAQPTPVGLWKTIDDSTKAEKSLVRISEKDGFLSGRIEKLFNTPEPHPKCDLCSDERKGQPVIGMTILRNVKRDGDSGYWSGGDILDPKNGKVYKVRLMPMGGGERLEVRGYIGVPALGRTQTWLRVE